MDDKKLPISDTPPNVSPVGDASVPPTPPLPEDAPPLPPLSPEKVKTPALPIQKSGEEKVPTEDAQPKPAVTTPPTTQENNDSVVPKENVAMPQPEPEAIKPTPQPDQVKQSGVDAPIAPPEKEEMPVEAEFPGQPLPVEAQQNLEDKAKEMIDKDGGVKNRKVEVVGKPKGNVKKTLVGMLLFVLVGGGAFAGMRLMGNTTENRSQAGVNVDDYCYCGGHDQICDGPDGIKGTDDDIKGRYTCTDGKPDCITTYEYCGGGTDDPEDTEDDDDFDVIRFKCCDGTYVLARESRTGASVCAYNGGYDDPDDPNDCGGVPVKLCTCESWVRVCGVNCKFPAGTASQAQQKANSLCKPIIAMCNVGTGKVTYEVYEEGHKCWGEANICKNPVAEPDCKEDPKACSESCTEGECDEGLTCDTTSNTCRNPSCPTSENCVCPEGDVICNSLTCDQGGLELGKSYSFTCNASVTGSKKIETYDFRYQINDDGWVNLPLSSVDSNVSSELFIEDPGSYVVECRACEDRTNKEKCTDYNTPDSH